MPFPNKKSKKIPTMLFQKIVIFMFHQKSSWSPNKNSIYIYDIYIYISIYLYLSISSWSPIQAPKTNTLCHRPSTPEVFGTARNCQGTRNSQRPEGYLRPAVQWPSVALVAGVGFSGEIRWVYPQVIWATQRGKIGKNAVLYNPMDLGVHKFTNYVQRKSS